MMFGHSPNQIFFNKKKIGRPEHSLPPTPLRPITSHFCLIPSPPPLKVDIMCITPKSTDLLFPLLPCSYRKAHQSLEAATGGVL